MHFFADKKSKNDVELSALSMVLINWNVLDELFAQC